MLVLALSLTGCEGDGGTNGGTTSGGTSGGGATEVAPSTPNGGTIYMNVRGSLCEPSKGGKVIIAGRNATPGDSFDVNVYFPYHSDKELQAGSRPAFANSVTVGGDGTFSWTFTCGAGNKRYGKGTYKVEFRYDGGVVKTESFEVAEYKG